MSQFKTTLDLVSAAHAEGHTYISKDEANLPTSYGLLVRDGLIAVKDGVVGRTKVVESEPIIANVIKGKLGRRNKGGDYAPISGTHLTDEQVGAVRTSLTSKVSIITGGPGTGKTTIIKELYEAARVAYGQAVHIATPTGRAAERAKAAISVSLKAGDQVPATIHRTLKYNPFFDRFYYGARKKLPYKFIIIDESSMVDTELMAALLLAVRDDASIVFVGDADQIPPVGPGCPFEDMVNSGALPTSRLTRVFRQAEDSDIKTLAYEIISGNSSVADTTRVPILPVSALPKRLESEVLAGSSIWISPQNKHGLGVDKLNEVLQNKLNPGLVPGQYVNHKGLSFKKGDKVTQRKNDYGLSMYNGDSGLVADVEELKGRLIIASYDKTLKKYPYAKLDNLSLGYCITIHRAQGSEWDKVTLVLPKYSMGMLSNRLLYTAITRAKKDLSIYCDVEVLKSAIVKPHPIRRTRLKKLLTASECIQPI